MEKCKMTNLITKFFDNFFYYFCIFCYIYDYKINFYYSLNILIIIIIDLNKYNANIKIITNAVGVLLFIFNYYTNYTFSSFALILDVLIHLLTLNLQFLLFFHY